jgi:hypothetical protein
MSEKLSIANEMRQFDRKNRNFYNELTDEEKKKFSTYLMIRWGSAVEGSRELQEFYVIACNERLNKHFFSETTSENQINTKKKTKIVNYCFYTINEANISKKIKEIPYFSNYYSIAEDYDFINISTIKEKVLEKIVLLDESKKYLLFTYSLFF